MKILFGSKDGIRGAMKSAALETFADGLLRSIALLGVASVTGQVMVGMTNCAPSQSEASSIPMGVLLALGFGGLVIPLFMLAVLLLWKCVLSAVLAVTQTQSRWVSLLCAIVVGWITVATSLAVLLLMDATDGTYRDLSYCGSETREFVEALLLADQ